MPPSRFLFARLNLIAEYDDKRTFLLKGLQHRRTRKVRNNLWGFFDVEVVPTHRDYATGYLVKLRSEQPEEVGDLETHAIATTHVQNRAISKSRFFIEIPTGLIAYQLVAPHIPQRTFEEQFARLFEEAHDGFFVSADVQTVEQRAQFFDALETFERVQKLEFELHPTNPHFDEIYRTVDERLKALRAKKYKETIAAAKDGPGLRALDDPEVRAKATMAEDGYGKASAVGTRDGKVARASTREHPVSAAADTRDRSVTDLLNDLLGHFREIMRRGAL